MKIRTKKPNQAPQKPLHFIGRVDETTKFYVSAPQALNQRKRRQLERRTGIRK